MESLRTVNMNPREQQLRLWLDGIVGAAYVLTRASDDASFRRYFRVQTEDGDSHIVMDAPPELENTGPFARISALLAAAGVHVPEVLAWDRQQGFMLLTDLGDRQYASVLSEQTVDKLYRDALVTLFRLQGITDTDSLPPYDRALLQRELGIFREWLLEAALQWTPDAGQETMLNGVFARLVENALAQPRVFVHRDYHSRNLMYCESNNPGVLDFQDAVYGPVTYDLVSLLRDCYIAWPAQRVQQWLQQCWQDLHAAGRIDCDIDTFRRWFDLMGMQRHLKAAGIFCRLKLRDGKDGYIADIPRTLNYVISVATAYPEFADFAAFLESEVMPRFKAGRLA